MFIFLPLILEYNGSLSLSDFFFLNKGCRVDLFLNAIVCCDNLDWSGKESNLFFSSCPGIKFISSCLYCLDNSTGKYYSFSL
jgi:hypothetical protein